MGNSLHRTFLLLIGGLAFLALMPNAWTQGPEDQPPATPLKDDVKDKCGGGKRELTLAPGKYLLSVNVVGGRRSCPVLVQPSEGLTNTGTNLPFSPVTVHTNQAKDFNVPNDGKVHKLVLQCGTPDADQKDCQYKYSVTPAASAAPLPPHAPPVVNPPGPGPTTGPTSPPPKPGPLAGAPEARVCKENHENKVIHKTQGIFILTVYHDSQCPVTVTDGVNQTVEPGQTCIVARKNVAADETIHLSCGDSEINYCRYKDQELAGVTGTIIQEPVNTSCKDATTVLQTDAGGIYFLDVAADSKSDCPPEVKVPGGATLFQNEANPVQPGSTSQFGFTIPVGSGPVTIEISCGTDENKKCIYTYKLTNAKRKLPKPPKLKAH
jgi:hypothetical protein